MSMVLNPLPFLFLFYYSLRLQLMKLYSPLRISKTLSETHPELCPPDDSNSHQTDEQDHPLYRAIQDQSSWESRIQETKYKCYGVGVGIISLLLSHGLLKYSCTNNYKKGRYKIPLIWVSPAKYLFSKKVFLVTCKSLLSTELWTWTVAEKQNKQTNKRLWPFSPVCKSYVLVKSNPQTGIQWTSIRKI